jgi:hypothetical protein
MNSSIVTLANEGMIRLTDNLIYSIRKAGLENRIYVLCTDKEAFSYYQNDDRVETLESEDIQSPETSNKYSEFGTKFFKNITFHKYPGIKQVLEKDNNDVIFIDGDISILKNLDLYFDKYKKLNYEILCSLNRDNAFCTGLTYFIYCDSTLKFIDQHIALSKEKILSKRYFDDQDIFNELADSESCTTKITRLSESQFCNGKYLIIKGEEEGGLNSRILDEEMYSVHANWIIGIESKILFLRKLGVYYIGSRFDHLKNSFLSRIFGAKNILNDIYHLYIKSK